jgi:TIR domain/WD domain, G-beta repeat
VAALVFISHSSKDRKIARTICTALESRGLTCWIASRDVGPGENFMDAIVRAIRAAKVMVLVFSENANNSDEIKREVVLAGNAKVTVIPVRIEDVVPGDAFAYQFATRQWIDLFEDWESQLDRLVAWIAGATSVETRPISATAKAQAGAAVQASTVDAPLLAPDIPTIDAKAVEDKSAEQRRQQEEDVKRRGQKQEHCAGEAEAEQRSHQETTVPANQVEGAKSQQLNRRAIVIGGTAAAVAIGGGVLSYQMWRTRSLIRTFDSGSGVNSVAFSPDGRSALSGHIDNNLYLWDISTGEHRSFTGHTSWVYSVAFSPDRRTALSGSNDKTLKLWDLESGELIRNFSGNTDSIRSVAFSPDGRTALSANGDEDAFKLWDVATGAVIRSFGEKAPYAVAFSPDGHTALAGGGFGDLGLWDIATGTETRKLNATASIIYTVAFSPDGRAALSGNVDRTLTLWGTAKGVTIRTLNGHTGDVKSAVFAPAGLTALSGSSDKTLRVWDLANSSTIRTLTGHSDEVNSVAIAPDGRTALSGSADGTLKLWDLT